MVRFLLLPTPGSHKWDCKHSAITEPRGNTDPEMLILNRNEILMKLHHEEVCERVQLLAGLLGSILHPPKGLSAWNGYAQKLA